MFPRLFDRYRYIFSFPAFRRFWIGFTASAIGDVMGRVALRLDRGAQRRHGRERRGQRGALAVGDGNERNAEVAGVGERGVQRAHRALGRRGPGEVRQREPRGRGGERRADHREQEIAAQDLLERAAVDRDEEHRGQREGVNELVERVARGLGDQAEAAGEVAAGHQPEDRQHRAQDRR